MEVSVYLVCPSEHQIGTGNESANGCVRSEDGLVSAKSKLRLKREFVLDIPNKSLFFPLLPGDIFIGIPPPLGRHLCRALVGLYECGFPFGERTKAGAVEQGETHAVVGCRAGLLVICVVLPEREDLPMFHKREWHLDLLVATILPLGQSSSLLQQRGWLFTLRTRRTRAVATTLGALEPLR